MKRRKTQNRKKRYSSRLLLHLQFERIYVHCWIQIISKKRIYFSIVDWFNSVSLHGFMLNTLESWIFDFFFFLFVRIAIFNGEIWNFDVKNNNIANSFIEETPSKARTSHFVSRDVAFNVCVSTDPLISSFIFTKRERKKFTNKELKIECFR